MIKIKTVLSISNMLLKQGRNSLSVKRATGNDSLVLDKLYEFIEFVSHVKSYVSFKGMLVTMMLALIVVLSAIGVVQSSHLSRQLFAEQAILLDRNDQLQLEWAQLLLEQSAWSSPNRLENVASKKLGMSMPEAENIQLIY
jgi:cell division protein FtsL